MTNRTTWHKRDKVWSGANSLFKWRFCSRRRRRCLSSLFNVEIAGRSYCWDSCVFLIFLPWCSKLHHFNGTACKTKLHRPHRTLQIRNEKSPRLRNVGPKRQSDNNRPMERIIRVPKSVKSFFVKSGILGIGIRRNTVQGICRYSVHYSACYNKFSPISCCSLSNPEPQNNPTCTWHNNVMSKWKANIKRKLVLTEKLTLRAQLTISSILATTNSARTEQE